MALIKVVRDKPEIPGGNTTAYVSEESLNEALSNGWKRSDDKPAKETKTETKPEVKEVKEEKTEEPKAEKTEVKTEVKKAKKAL